MTNGNNMTARGVNAILLVLASLLILGNPLPVYAEESPDAVLNRDIRIFRIPSPYGGGYGYRLKYSMPVPLDVCWRFKTDFGSDFLLRSSLITAHRLLRRNGNVAVTETVYAAAPGKRFIWKTTTDPRTHRMIFRLMNPHSAGQRYHSGVIRLIESGNRTVIIQEAYFDFVGAVFWVHNPLQGGMRDILKTTARWEQQTVGQLQAAYG